MSWAAKQEAIRLAVSRAMSLPDFTGADGQPHPVVEWQNRPTASRWAPSGVTVELRMGEIVVVGQDEERTEEVDGRLVSHYSGVRRFTVSVLITSNSQLGGEDAVAELAGRLRTRIQSQRVTPILKAAGVGFARHLATLNADYADDQDRMRSAALIDLLFNTRETWVDTEALADDTLGQWVETVETEGSTLVHPDGTTLDVDASITVEGGIVTDDGSTVVPG